MSAVASKQKSPSGDFCLSSVTMLLAEYSDEKADN